MTVYGSSDKSMIDNTKNEYYIFMGHEKADYNRSFDYHENAGNRTVVAMRVGNGKLGRKPEYALYAINNV